MLTSRETDHKVTISYNILLRMGLNMSLQKKLLDWMGLMKTDFPASLELIADDIHWVNFLPDHVPFGGEYDGHAGLMQYFGELAATFEVGDYVYEEFEFIETGNTVVMVGAETNAKVIPTRKVFDLPFVWVVKFNDEGKICYLREHNDTAAIGDAFRS
jgi:ketosteroid isomerase-like protein